jgi:excisionase family DNA binding protein
LSVLKVFLFQPKLKVVGILSAYREAGSYPSDIRRSVAMEEILTAAQVAELLQVHPRTVYKLAKRGSIPGRKFGGGWRFSKSEIILMISPQGAGRFPERGSTDER